MPRIYVNYEQMLQMQRQIAEISSEVKRIRWEFLMTEHRIDWDVRFKDDIDATAKRILSSLEDEADTLKKFNNYLGDAYKIYMELDRYKAPELEETISNTNKTDFRKNIEDMASQILAFIKAALNLLKKMGSSEKAGPAKAIISYLESLYKFFSGDLKGLTGISDWCNIADKSVSVWKSLYDYYEKGVKDKIGIFSETGQKGAEGLGILGGGMGLLSDIFGAVDTIQNSDKGITGIIGEFIESGDNVVDMVKGGVELKHVGDEAVNITTKGSNGLYSPLSCYTAIAKGYVDAIAQAFESVDKYSADGKWSLDDTARTGIELSVKGLYTMVDSLSFGIISENTTGVSADDISNGLENWAGNLGKNIGEYIRKDPQLRNTYNKSGPLGKFALLYYASYASVLG